MPKFFRNLPLILVIALSASPSIAADRVWFESRIAEISVGFEKEHLQRGYYLSLVGPIEADGLSIGAVRQCGQAIAVGKKRTLRDSLDAGAIAIQRKPDISAAERDQQLRNQAIKHLIVATADMRERVFTCLRKQRPSLPPAVEEKFYLTLVLRDCDKKTCSDSTTGEKLAGTVDARVFEALHRWATKNATVENRNMPNVHSRLGFAGTESLSLTSIVQPITETNKWKPAPDAKTLRKQHLALIEKIRAANATVAAAPQQLSFASGILLDAARDDFVKAADVYSDAVDGYGLALKSATTILSGMSDEIARTRLTECRFFQGHQALTDLSNCAGYDLDENILAKCLSSQICEPTIRNSADGIALLIAQPLNLKDLSKFAPLPRLKMPGELAAVISTYNDCSVANASQTEAELCFAKYLVASNPNTAFAAECLTKSTNDKARLQCALSTLAPTLPPEIQCASQSTNRAKIECLVAPQLSQDARAAIDCAKQVGNSALLACAGQLLGPEVGKVTDCLPQRNSGTFAFAGCLMESKLSAKDKAALQCVQNSGADAIRLAACAIESQLPPKLAMQLGCVTRSAGDPVGIGTCLATQNLNLNPNQQLALQCLATTGGEPSLFATCVAGQLTMAEMQQCKGKSFGEGNCFGENNEFQKFAKLVTGDTISSNSVVGQILTVQMKPVQLTLSLAEPFLNEGTKRLGEAVQQIEQTATDIKDALRGDRKALERVIRGVVFDQAEKMTNKVKDFIRKPGFKL